MARTRNIVKYLTVDTAVRERKCHTDKTHKIAAGQMHLRQEVSLNVYENICLICAGNVLDVAQANLADIRKKLGV